MHRESSRPRTKHTCYTTNAIHVHERRIHYRRLDIFKSTCMTLRRRCQEFLYLFASNTLNNILSTCIAGERVHLDGVQDKRFFFFFLVAPPMPLFRPQHDGRYEHTPFCSLLWLYCSG